MFSMQGRNFQRKRTEIPKTRCIEKQYVKDEEFLSDYQILDLNASFWLITNADLKFFEAHTLLNSFSFYGESRTYHQL